MRASRIVNRWNLKSRAKAGRYLLAWQQRLNEGARNLYLSGMQDALLEAASKERNEQPSLSPRLLPRMPTLTGYSQGLIGLQVGAL